MLIDIYHSSSELYGSDKSLLELARGLAGRYDVRIVLPSEGELTEACRNSGLDVTVSKAVVKVDRSSFKSPGRVLNSLSATLPRSFARHRPDLVHSNTTGILGGAIVAKAVNRPHLWTVREIIEKPVLLRKSIAEALQWGATAVAYNSEATRSYWESANGRLRSKGVVVKNRVASGSFVSNLDTASARAKLHLERACPSLALVGRLNAWKGHSQLLAALSSERFASLGDLDILFAGDAVPGDDVTIPRLKELSRRLPSGMQVHFLGFVTDVSDVYRAVDLVVAPSARPEPFGRVAAEAHLHGRPVVGTYGGGLAEIIHNERTGLLVPMGDVEALATAVYRLLTNPEDCARMSREATASSAAESVADLIHEYTSLYDRLITRARP